MRQAVKDWTERAKHRHDVVWHACGAGAFSNTSSGWFGIACCCLILDSRSIRMSQDGCSFFVPYYNSQDNVDFMTVVTIHL